MTIWLNRPVINHLNKRKNNNRNFLRKYYNRAITDNGVHSKHKSMRDLILNFLTLILIKHKVQKLQKT